MHLIRYALLAAALMSLSGCKSDDGALSPAVRLAESDWRAEAINGVPVSSSTRVTLSFNEGNASGRGGCNQYSGSVTMDDRRISFGPLISTKMACVDGNAMQTEATYFAALQGAQSYAFAPADKLTISGAAGNIVFAPQPRQIRPQ